MRQHIFWAILLASLLGSVRPADAVPYHQALSRRASSSEYLYIATYKATARYPIVNGVVSQNPTSALNASPAAGRDGLAVAADGTIYMFSQVMVRRKYVLAVNVYAPGATGNALPIRQILLPPTSFTYGGIAVDGQGYLYLLDSLPGAAYVYVYAPNASGSVSPIQAFHDFGYWITLDTKGNLYVSDDNEGVRVWANPATHPTLVRQICLTDQAAGVAVAPSGETFIAAETRWLHRPRRDVIRTYGGREDACPASLRSFFRTTPGFQEPSDLVEYAGSLFLSESSGSGGAVMQFPESGPNPRPVTTTIAQGAATVAVGLAVGP